MRQSFILSILLCLALFTRAEGTKQVAPNGSINIDGNTTTDIAALHLDNVSYNSFGQYDNPDTTSRLNVRIVDPNAECIYIGFSAGHLNQTTPTPPQVTFEFRIKDPNGNVVFGPFIVDPADANVADWSEAFMGPEEVNGPGGYMAIQINSSDLTSQGWNSSGDYYIEFREENNQPFLIDFWDITVVDCSTTFPEERPGRVWSYNWAIFAINDFGFPVRPFNGAFFVCAPDPDNSDAAFVTRIDFNESGFRPAAFNVAFNSFGSMKTGNVPEDRKSVENLNATQAEYEVFLNDPVEFCETAVAGEIDLIGVSRCSVDDYCIKFVSNKEGQIDLLLDFDGPDSMFTPGTADLIITTQVEEGQVNVPACIDWNGLDGLGNPLPQDAASTIPVILSYAQGIYHFPIYDAEFMDNGFRVESVRPPGDVPLLFYDDSNISTPSGSGEPQVQLSGCDVPCHTWSVFNDPNVPGFGNLNTINSWWFAQQLVTRELFVLPGIYECQVIGPDAICEGQTDILEWQGNVIPEGAGAGLEIVSLEWSGPGIVGSNMGETIEIESAGAYQVDMTWLTALGDTCTGFCDIMVDIKFSSSETIDTTIGSGDTLVVNGEEYTETGEYIQTLVAANGCDSTLIILLTVPVTVVTYDLDDCLATIADGANQDYTEFTPEYPNPLSCSSVDATVIFRENSMMNIHSCTPGVSGSVAICVSSREECDYAEDDDRAIVFEVTVNPDSASNTVINSFSFFELAPEMYDWINGFSGTNNYPTLYGLRILQNGSEVFRIEDVPTSNEWSEQRYDLNLVAEGPTTFRFELLGYCVVGNDSQVTAWDLDNLSVQASCTPKDPGQGLVSGTVFSHQGKAVQGALVEVSTHPQFLDSEVAMTDEDGSYSNPFAEIEETNYIKALKDDDHLNGITTMDLLLILKHLRGLDEFTSPWQLVASDINRDGMLSVTDVVELRRVMLGLNEGFARNTSWRFWHAPAFIDDYNPFELKEVYQIDDFGGDEQNINFVGVKVGDVNATATHNAGDQRSMNTILVSTTDRLVKAGEIVTMELSMDASACEAFQFELQTEGEFLGIWSDGLQIDQTNYHVDGDNVRVIWVNENTNRERTYNVTIEFRAESDGALSELVSFSEETLTADAYFDNGVIDVAELQLEFNGVVPALQEVSTLLVAPNPFFEETAIMFDAALDGAGQLVLTDMNGRIIMARQLAVTRGSNTLSINRRMINDHKGLIIAQLQVGQSVHHAKLIAH